MIAPRFCTSANAVALMHHHLRHSQKLVSKPPKGKSHYFAFRLLTFFWLDCVPAMSYSNVNLDYALQVARLQR